MSSLISRFMSCNTDKILPSSDSSSFEIPMRICYVIKKWLQICPETFQKDCKLNQTLVFLVEKYLMDKTFLNKSARKIKKLLDSNIISNKRKSVEIGMDSQKYVAPLLPSMFSGSNFRFIDLDPLEVARQLCLFDHSIYCDIEASELNKCQWSKPQKHLHAPNITKLISRFNQCSKWVSSQIVQTQDLDPRAFVLSRFIVIALHCFRLRNFNFTAAVISALNR
jgi:son of sevenless